MTTAEFAMNYAQLEDICEKIDKQIENMVRHISELRTLMNSIDRTNHSTAYAACQREIDINEEEKEYLTALVKELRDLLKTTNVTDEWLVSLVGLLSDVSYADEDKINNIINAIRTDNEGALNELADSEQRNLLEEFAEKSELSDTEKEELFKKWEKADTSAKSALITSLGQLTKSAVESAVQDGLAENITDALVNFIRYNNPIPALAAETVNGTNVVIGYTDDICNAMGKAAKAAPVVGAVIDFGMQIASGEEVGDAAIKTGAHALIGVGVTAAATLIIGATPVGWAAVGVAAVTFAASQAFDYLYDNYADDVVNAINTAVDKVSDAIDSIGDAVSGFFSGVCKCFA